MAQVAPQTETTLQRIFQIVGNSLGATFDHVIEDDEDKRFMDHFYPDDEHTPWVTFCDASIKPFQDMSSMTSSLTSDDSGICLSPNSKTDYDEDDLSVVLDENDIAKLSDFFKEEILSEDSENSLQMTPEEGLNLPILPKLGLDTDDSLTPVRKSGSVEYDDETEIESSDSDGEYNPPNRKGCKNVLLWKFLLNLLAESSDSGGAMVQWEDRQRGIFKFVDTVRISRLWGDQKNKDDMNFEKLSRGIRHYYRGGLMSRVEGRRLVYQFNWKKVPKSFRQKR